MLDIGASLTVIDSRIRQSLNLSPFRIRSMHVPGQTTPIRSLCYKADLMVLHASGNLVVPMLTVLESPLSHMGVDVLVGCDVLSHCTLIYHGQGRDWMLIY
jgi:hypothetical protein